MDPILKWSGLEFGATVTKNHTVITVKLTVSLSTVIISFSYLVKAMKEATAEENLLLLYHPRTNWTPIVPVIHRRQVGSKLLYSLYQVVLKST